MRFILSAALAVTMILGLCAAGVAGTWIGSMDTPMGTIETTITFQAGATLAGTVKSNAFEARIENAKLDGDKISFEINLEQGKLTYEGSVAGDEMKLTVTGTTGNKYPMNCKRQK